MPFDQSTFAPLSAHASNSPKVYTYRTIADPLPTINTPGYFDDKRFQLEVGDIIIVVIGTESNSLEVTAVDPTVSTTVNPAKVGGNIGIGTDAPLSELHILGQSGLTSIRVENENPNNGILQVQLINDDDKELSIGKLGSAVNFFGVESGAILNRSGNMNIVSDSNDPIIFYTDLSDSQNLSATEKARLQPNGEWIMGLLSSGNYAKFEADGTLEFVGTAQMWRDENFDVAILGSTSGSIPDRINLASTTIEVAAFNGVSTLEEVNGAVELNHDYAEGEDIRPHIHWYPTTAGAGDVVWQLEYAIIGANDIASTSTTIELTDSTNSIAWEALRTEFPVISGAGLQIGDQVHFRLFRDPSAGGDTYTADAAVSTFGFHIPVNTIGSRDIFTK